LGPLGPWGHESHGKATRFGKAMGVPENGWFIMGHPKNNMDNLGVLPHFRKPPFFKKRHLLTLNEFIEPRLIGISSNHPILIPLVKYLHDWW